MSQVTQHQDFIMYPAGVYEYLPIDGKEVGGSVPVKKKPEDDKVIIIYLNQIWMRVILNEAHNALYRAGILYLKAFDLHVLNNRRRQRKVRPRRYHSRS
jgi:hypothetical protein